MGRHAMTPEGREIARLKRVVQLKQNELAAKDAQIESVKVSAFHQHESLIAVIGDLLARLSAKETD